MIYRSKGFTNAKCKKRECWKQVVFAKSEKIQISLDVDLLSRVSPAGALKYLESIPLVPSLVSSAVYPDTIILYPGRKKHK